MRISDWSSDVCSSDLRAACRWYGDSIASNSRQGENMDLKVIGAGFGRTGTLSVCTALNQLGFPCYHMFEVLENKQNKSHLDFWRKVANQKPGTQLDWQRVFASTEERSAGKACVKTCKSRWAA